MLGGRSAAGRGGSLLRTQPEQRTGLEELPFTGPASVVGQRASGPRMAHDWRWRALLVMPEGSTARALSGCPGRSRVHPGTAPHSPQSPPRDLPPSETKRYKGGRRYVVACLRRAKNGHCDSAIRLRDSTTFCTGFGLSADGDSACTVPLVLIHHSSCVFGGGKGEISTAAAMTSGGEQAKGNRARGPWFA